MTAAATIAQEGGRAADAEPALVSDQAASRLAPPGFDPARKEPVDWIEEGRKHFLNTKLHPERLASNYPTQNVNTPKDEADFILGFRAAKGEWEAGKGLSGISAYAEERDAQAIEARRAATAQTGAVEDESAVPQGCAQNSPDGSPL